MTDLKATYGPGFFAEWGAGNADYVATARYITQVLLDEFRPRRLIDLGSGCGVYSFFFRDAGTRVVSVDAVQAPPEHSFPGKVEIRDLSRPVENIWGKFDLTLCLEVAEHVPEKDSGTFLANIAQFSDLLVFSAAPPYQGGTHHVNEQPKRYWRNRLAETNFIYNRRRTGRLSEKFKRDKPPLMWMCQQISVYERGLSKV